MARNIKTGDMVKMGAGGNVYYQERDKDLLKVGGENVSAKEVEDLVVTHPAVQSVAVVGKQHEFTEKHSFDFPLLSDPDRKVAESMGVKRMLRVLGPNRRTTFVIDTDRKVLATFDSQVNMNSHADGALEVLRRRSAPA